LRPARGTDPLGRERGRRSTTAGHTSRPLSRIARSSSRSRTRARARKSYPLVANLQTGQLQYDNYNGHWGEQKHLKSFLQAYAVEKAKVEARKKGHSVSETKLGDGSIRATVRVGGAA